MPSALSQIAIRLPKELLGLAEDLAAARRTRLKRAGRFSEAHRLNRSAILRDALERGLAALAEDLDKRPERR